MRILFASPERDLIECYKTILDADLGETVTAFDATQVLFLVTSERFDIAVLDCGLQRIEYGRLISRVKGSGIPVVSLLNGKEDGAPSADAYLAFPFDAQDLEKTIKDTIARPRTGDGSEGVNENE